MPRKESFIYEGLGMQVPLSSCTTYLISAGNLLHLLMGADGTFLPISRVNFKSQV